MATVYSTQQSSSGLAIIPLKEPKPTNLLAGVRVAYSEYEASSLASGDVIEMFNLPNGARIISAKLCHDALGGSTTLSVGYAAHTDSAGSAVAAAAAGLKQQQLLQVHNV